MEQRTFSAHTQFEAGRLALSYLDQKPGCRILPLTGEDPCPPTGCVLFVRCPLVGSYQHPYLSLQDLSKAPADDSEAERLHWILEHMRWAARADYIVFINPTCLSGSGGLDSEHALNFHRALDGLLAQTA